MDQIIINRIESVKVLGEIHWQNQNVITCSVELSLKGTLKVIHRNLDITVNIRPVPKNSEIVKIIQNAGNYLYPKYNQAQLSFGNNISTMYESLVFHLDWN